MRPSKYAIAAALCFSTVFMACSDGATDTPPPAAAPSAEASQTDKLDANKKLVTDFYQALLGDKDSTAIDKYVADNVKQHNPLFQDGKDWLKTALRPFLENPNVEKTKVDIVHSAAEGDMVWLHVRDVAPNGKVFARVAIFRIENGKIAESWKVAEAVPANSANQNSPF